MVDRALLEADMDEYAEGDSWPEPCEDGEPAPLPDPTAVSGVLSRLKRLAAEVVEINEVADAEIARRDAWRHDRIAGIKVQIAWGERSVENFMRQFAPAARKRSLALSDGTLKLSKPRESVVVTDLEAFLSWCDAVVPEPVEGTEPTELDLDAVKHRDLLRFKAEPNKRALGALDRGGRDTSEEGIISHALSLPGGELVPGVEIRYAAEDKFNVTLRED